MVIGEGDGMKRFGRGVVRGGAPISLDILCWSEKFPPSGVGFFTVRHPAHWGGDPPGGGGVRKSFLLALFKGAITKVPMQGITCLPVKQAGMEIPNTDMSAWENWLASCFFTGHLVAALRGRTEFKTGYHSMLLKEGCGERSYRQVQE